MGGRGGGVRQPQGFRTLTIAVLCAALGACALPAAAPTSMEVEGSIDQSSFPFTAVTIDDRVVTILGRYTGPSLSGTYKRARYAATNALHAGDAVAVTVYETGGSTLFGSTVPAPGSTVPQQGVIPAGATTIPPQIIEADGTINVPFVGRL